MTVEHLPSGAKIATLESAERVEFGPLAHYRPLMADGSPPVRPGIPVSEPGSVAPRHSHPSVGMLFILLGRAAGSMEGPAGAKRRR